MTRLRIKRNGTRIWYNSNGELHRIGGPACEYSDGTRMWYKDGEYHREEGPAIEYADGNKFWFKNGRYHREDGPAVEMANGDKEWWFDDIEYLSGEFKNEHIYGNYKNI